MSTAQLLARSLKSELERDAAKKLNMEEMKKVDETELHVRIDHELHHHADVLPPVINAAWRGYLAACIEWGLIDADTFVRILDRLPPLDPDPVVGILLGYDGISDSTE